jgi:hypothetical protein
MVIGRLWDLLAVLRDCYYHPGFGGSFSLKSVVPALASDLSYDVLAISDGEVAKARFQERAEGRLADADWAAVSEALHIYCAQDVSAMARVLGALRKAAYP